MSNLLAAVLCGIVSALFFVVFVGLVSAMPPAQRLRRFGVFASLMGFSILVAASFAAFAQTADATVATTTVDASPFVAWLQPYITAILTSLIVGLLGMAFAWLSKTFGLNIDQKNRDALAAAATTAAGSVLAKVSGNLATVQFDARNPLIAQAVNYVLAAVPGALAHFEMEPDAIAQMILGKIGQLQAAATTVVAAPPAAK